MRLRTVLNGVCGLLVAMSAVCSALAQTEQCNSGCNAVLQGGVFNEDKINSSQTSKDSFHDWMCVSEFKNHNEAHDAGINIGVVVYDVPISLGGTWKDGQREEWQRKSCTDQQRHAEKISTFTRALRTASPEILAAWSKCVETTCSAGRPRLKCEVTSVKGAALFKSNWIRQTGELSTIAGKMGSKVRQELTVAKARMDIKVHNGIVTSQARTAAPMELMVELGRRVAMVDLGGGEEMEALSFTPYSKE